MVTPSTKWAVNITKKYIVASSATVSKIVGTLNPATLRQDRAVKNKMNKNAEESNTHIVSRVSDIQFKSRMLIIRARTIQEGDPGVYDLQGSVSDKNTHTIRVQWYLRKFLGYNHPSLGQLPRHEGKVSPPCIIVRIITYTPSKNWEAVMTANPTTTVALLIVTAYIL